MTLLSEASIAQAALRAAQAASNACQVVLFGSYARGDANEESDLDLLIIESAVPDKSEEYFRVHRAIGAMGVGVDVIVMDECEYARRKQVPGTLPYWASREGKVLYDAAA